MLKIIFKNKVFQNFSFLTISSTISQLIGLVAILKISRIFAPEEYGLYTFIFAQSLLINAIGDLGMRNIITRSISRDALKTNDLVYNGLKLRLIATFILMLLYIVYNYFLGSLNAIQILILYLFSLTGIIANLFENVFIGREKMLAPSLTTIGYNLLFTVIIFALPSRHFTVNILLYFLLACGIIKSVILYSILNWKGLLVGHINDFLSSSKIYLKESRPYFFLFLVMLPTVYFANNFLDVNSTKAEIGYFNLSQRLMGPVSTVLNVALLALFPNLSSLWIKDEKKFYTIISVGFRYFLLLAAILCFLFTLFSREVVVLLFSDNYLPAVKVCQLQVWYVFLMGVNSLIGTIWGSTNKEKLILKTAIVNAVISTPILYFGSFYGAMGLSYGYVISFAIFEIFLWRLFIKSEKIVITKDWLLWSIALLFFLVSYFFPKNISIFYRMTIAVFVLSIYFWYGIRNYKTIKSEIQLNQQ